MLNLCIKISLKHNILIKFKLSNANGICCIVGKPGVGKSHVVSELDEYSSCLYRFYISEQDNDKSERLKYKNFITNLSIRIFNNF